MVSCEHSQFGLYLFKDTAHCTDLQMNYYAPAGLTHNTPCCAAGTVQHCGVPPCFLQLCFNAATVPALDGVLQSKAMK